MPTTERATLASAEPAPEGVAPAPLVEPTEWGRDVAYFTSPISWRAADALDRQMPGRT